MKKLTLIAIVLFFLIDTGCNKVKDGPWPKGMYGKIICIKKTGPEEIALIDESGLHQVTFNSEKDVHFPRWSPDGKKIVYVGGMHGGNIHTVNADGSEDNIVLEGEYYDPSWSPDGTKILFSNGVIQPVDSGLFVTNLDGTEIALLTPLGGLQSDWSPDGKTIATVQYKTGALIYLINLLDNTEELLTSGRSPRWSPDGSKIAYRFNENIYVLDVNSRAQTKLTSSEGDNYTDYPCWSPSGDKIAFTSYEINNVVIGQAVWDYIYVMNQDGSNKVKLDFGEHEFMQMPDWHN